MINQMKITAIPKLLKKINLDGSPMLKEEFTETVKEFKEWCNKHKEDLKKIFL